jgi:cardiolipin synthase
MSDRLLARLNPLHAAPNLLTLMRICMAPFLVSAILDYRFSLSFALFIVAGLTDALDGTLARWLKQRTVLGQYLDPVADKLLLSTLFVVLTHQKLIPVTITVLVFGRDVGILLVAALLYAAVGRREFKPSPLGKANTLAQVTAVAAVLLGQVYVAKWVVILRVVALDATVVLTVASGLHYAWLVTRRMSTPATEGTSGAGK